MKSHKRDLVRISGKNLGAVALPSFCPRCFWIKLRLRFALPYQIFPGIFSSIDGYTKRMVHAWFDKRGGPPPWLDGIGAIVDYREPPHYTKFNIVVDKHGIFLTGAPDGTFVLADRSYLIIDYRTAKFSAKQDELFPMYEAQLNAYAVIGEQCGFAPVSRLALAYMEPVTEVTGNGADLYRDNGFAMEFSAHLMPVEIDRYLVDRLLARVRELHDLRRPPKGAPRCKDCSLLDGLYELAAGPDVDS